MRSRIRLLSFVAVLVSTAYANVKFIGPKGGAKLTGGGAISIEWEDSGSGPAIDDLTTYQLFLCAGGNTEGSFQQLAEITTQGSFANGNKAQGTIPPNIGASTPENAYFIKMIAVARAGGQAILYSPRFTLTGMTGVFPPPVLAGARTITTTAGPADVNQVNADPAGAPAAAGDFAVPFADQTGLTRYAPMQRVPPTKISAKGYTPMYPTSSVVIATTFLPIPSVQTTVTQLPTFTPKFRENPAPAAPMPNDDMQKFLNRWKD